MTTTNRPGGAPDLAWAEVEACTLPTTERPLRMAEFDDLFATTLRAVQRPGVATRAHLVLADRVEPADLAELEERVRALTDAESACCSFFTFGVTVLKPDSTAGEVPAVTLDIEVPPAYVEVLDALLDRARIVSGLDAGRVS